VCQSVTRVLLRSLLRSGGPSEWRTVTKIWGGKLALITNRKSYTSFRLVPKLVTLNDLERRTGFAFRYFTNFGKPAFQHITASISGGIYARDFVVSVRCRRKESSRSLSHFLISFLRSLLKTFFIFVCNLCNFYYHFIVELRFVS